MVMTKDTQQRTSKKRSPKKKTAKKTAAKATASRTKKTAKPSGSDVTDEKKASVSIVERAVLVARRRMPQSLEYAKKLSRRK